MFHFQYSETQCVNPFKMKRKREQEMKKTSWNACGFLLYFMVEFQSHQCLTPRSATTTIARHSRHHRIVPSIQWNIYCKFGNLLGYFCAYFSREKKTKNKNKSPEINKKRRVKTDMQTTYAITSTCVWCEPANAVSKMIVSATFRRRRKHFQ